MFSRYFSQVCSKTRNIQIRPVVENFCVAEGPHWDHENNLLLFVDIWGKTINKYHPYSNQHECIQTDDSVSFVIPVRCAENQYIIGTGRKLCLLTWDCDQKDTKRIMYIKGKDENECIYTRLNDAKADDLGNLFFGSMKRESDEADDKEEDIVDRGEFYKLDPINGKIETILSPVSISNGITWNKSRTKMFYADSLTRRIDVFDYNSKTGRVKNRRVFFEFGNFIKGMPDGITTDCNDNLWIACFCGSKVICVSTRSGIILDVVNLPVERVTSVVFGGENMDILFVTSAQMGLTLEEKEEQPLAGSLFQVEGLGVMGLQSNSVVLPRNFHNLEVIPYKGLQKQKIKTDTCNEIEKECYIHAISGCKQRNPCMKKIKKKKEQIKKIDKIPKSELKREQCPAFKLLKMNQSKRDDCKPNETPCKKDECKQQNNECPPLFEKSTFEECECKEKKNGDCQLVTNEIENGCKKEEKKDKSDEECKPPDIFN